MYRRRPGQVLARSILLLFFATAAFAEESEVGTPGPAETGEEDPGFESDEERSGEATARAEFDDATSGLPDDVEEITVRATKQQGNLQTTPVAASVFKMDQLDQGNIQNFESLSFSIPNFNYREELGGASFTIRGIGSLGGGPNTAFHIDGIYQANPYTASGIAFFDLAGIEVLRGPTGTQYGRNANAGALNLLTRPPSFDFEAYGDAQYGSFHEIRTRGVLNVPVLQDKLAVRFSGITNRRYGYTENLNSGIRRNDPDDDRSAAIRGQILFQPNEDFEWVSRITYVHDRSNGLSSKIEGDYPSSAPLGAVPVDVYVNAPQPNPTDPRQVYLDSPVSNNRDFIMANTTLAWSLPDLEWIGDATIVLNGGYQQSDQWGVGDLDLSNAFSTGLTSGSNAAPFRILEVDIAGDSAEWVAELSFKADSTLPFRDSDVQWALGAFYFGTRSDVVTASSVNLQVATIPAGGLLGRGTGVSDALDYEYSAAAFGSFEFELTDTVKLFGGLRYSWDRLTGRQQTTGLELTFPDVPLPPQCVNAPIDDSGSASTGAVMGRVGVEWQAHDESMLYASFSTGSKPRTLELARTGPNCTVLRADPTEPEQLLAWEMGSRNRILDNKLQLNATGFAYLWDDIQVTTIVESNFITQNANSAVAGGFELEAVATPLMEVSVPYFSIDTFLSTFNFGLTYSEFTDFRDGCLAEDPTTCTPASAGGNPQDWTGNQLPNSPLFTLTLTGQYEQYLGDYGSLTPYFRLYYSDEIYFRASNLPRDLQPAYALLDVTLTWRNVAGNLSLEGFVNNVTDKDIASQKTIGAFAVGSPTVVAYQPPRTWGVRLGLEW